MPAPKPERKADELGKSAQDLANALDTIAKAFQASAAALHRETAARARQARQAAQSKRGKPTEAATAAPAAAPAKPGFWSRMFGRKEPPPQNEKLKGFQEAAVERSKRTAEKAKESKERATKTRETAEEKKPAKPKEDMIQRAARLGTMGGEVGLLYKLMTAFLQIGQGKPSEDVDAEGLRQMVQKGLINEQIDPVVKLVEKVSELLKPFGEALNNISNTLERIRAALPRFLGGGK